MLWRRVTRLLDDASPLTICSRRGWTLATAAIVAISVMTLAAPGISGARRADEATATAAVELADDAMSGGPRRGSGVDDIDSLQREIAAARDAAVCLPERDPGLIELIDQLGRRARELRERRNRLNVLIHAGFDLAPAGTAAADEPAPESVQ